MGKKVVINIEKILDVKVINFNKDKWKNLINIKCEIYKDGCMGYEIILLKDGKPFENYTFGLTRKMIENHGECFAALFFQTGLVFDQIGKNFGEEYIDAIEEAFNDLEEFLHSYDIENS